MADVLSQSEIDNLLKALSSGEVDVDEMKETSDKSVKEYDFKRPAKFSKEHLRTLEIIFEHFGRLLSTNLPVYLRKNVQVSVVNSEALTFSEFTNSLANPVILGIINFNPLNGSVMMELAANPSTTRKQRVDILHDAADVQRIARKYLLGTEAEVEEKAERQELISTTQEHREEILSRLESAQGDVLNLAQDLHEAGKTDAAEKLMEVSEDLQIIGKIISEEQTQ